MWRNWSGQPLISAQKEATPCSASRSCWNNFRRCFGQENGLENERAYFQASPRNRNCNPDIECRINQWILDSSLCYGKESDISENNDNSPRQISEVSDGLVFSDSDSAGIFIYNALLPTQVASATVQNRERNRNRWKGRLTANSIESHSISLLTTYADTAPQPEVRIKLRDHHAKNPTAPTRPTTSQLVPIPLQAARDVSSRRTKWMRRSAVLRGRRASARISAQPESIWLVPASCASRLA